jgi:CRP-like cAMP-binding protein
MQSLVNYLDAVYPLPAELVKHLCQRVTSKQLLKGHYWIKQGQPADKVAFIEKGLMKIFYLIGNKEIINWFSRENDFVIAGQDFFRDKPSRYNIQAIENSLIWFLPKQELQYIYEKFPSFNINARIITENFYCLAEDQRYLLYSNHRQRYDLIREKQWLLKRVPDKYLASYLGLTPSNFCRYKVQ